MERGRAHAGKPGEVGDPHPFGIVVTDPSDRPVDVGKVAVRQADLPDHITERAGEQPPEDFPFNQWCEHRRVGGVVEQSATILLANVISIGPAVTAMRTHPASVLREE